MSLLVRAFPLVCPIDEVRQFASALAERKAETDAFYRNLGVTHESWHVQETPSGPWVIGVTKVGDQAEAAPRYAASAASFDVWFKSQVRRLCGVDPDQQPLGPPTTQVFVWSDAARADSNLCA
jgi:hypothetical protein